MYSKISEEKMKLLVKLILAENDNINLISITEIKNETSLYLSNIILKRIEVLKLPIKFTYNALASVNIFVDRAGSAVLLLIDCLNNFNENHTVTVKDLCKLYPFGFYDEENFVKRIDEIKEQKDQYIDAKNNNKELPKIGWNYIY